MHRQMQRSINLVTEIPGPKSRELMRRKETAVPAALTVHVPVAVAEARGALVTDVDGNTFIDLSGGLGCLNVGHSAPAVVEAIRRQAGLYTHTDFSVILYEPYVRLAERLCALAPGASSKKAAFFNSGAEAVENAVKFARKYTGKPAVIAFEGGFHGRTLLTMSLTSKVRPYKEGFGPFAPEIYRVPFPNPYRSQDPDGGARAAVEALERAFTTAVSAGETAAVILEPVQGEGGFVVPPPGFIPRVKEVCERRGVLLIADEVQTGFGRTGRFFALEHSGVEADLLVIGKSLAAGLPLSGVIGRREIMDAPGDSAIGGTYVGNAVACAAALAVLDVIERDRLVERARELGRALTARFERMSQSCPLIGNVRGLGAMMGIELVRDRRTKEPAADETAEVLRRCTGRGVVAVRSGVYGNVIRMLMPLVITDDQLDEALGVLEESLGGGAIF